MTVPPFRSLPKIELHCHLDACVRVETVADIGRDIGLALPQPLGAALVAPDTCADLFDYISRIDLALEVMQRPDDLTRIAREAVEDMARDGVIHGELRFAPQLHTRRGLRPEQVLEAVQRGLAAGVEEHGVSIGLIVCCLRHERPEQSLAVAQLASAHRHIVCALDLAGDEARHSDAEPHVPAFDLAHSAGLYVTAHAGENAGAESVRQAIDRLGAERIGHGVRIVEDEALCERAIARGIAFDMCPRSNVQTRAVESLASHPIDRLLARGARVTVSTDGRTVSRTTVGEEFERLAVQFGWGLREFWACQRNAARAAFVSHEKREELLARIQRASTAADV